MIDIQEMINKMESNGLITKDEIENFMPNNNQKIKKLAFWRNSTPLAPRWDGEIWYEDGSQQRITYVNRSIKRLLIEMLNEQE